MSYELDAEEQSILNQVIEEKLSAKPLCQAPDNVAGAAPAVRDASAGDAHLQTEQNMSTVENAAEAMCWEQCEHGVPVRLESSKHGRVLGRIHLLERKLAASGYGDLELTLKLHREYNSGAMTVLRGGAKTLSKELLQKAQVRDMCLFNDVCSCHLTAHLVHCSFISCASRSCLRKVGHWIAMNSSRDAHMLSPSTTWQSITVIAGCQPRHCACCSRR